MRRIFGSVAALAAALLIVAQTSAAPRFPAFQGLWERQDLAVSEHVTDRSWTWGPAPIGEPTQEAYTEGFNGKRVVLYYDKSRMEINDPAADASSHWYVTNGLLPIEMMTGRQQNGLASFEQRAPARISAIGDAGQYPTYADLVHLYQNPGEVNLGDLGKPATGFLNLDGSITGFNDFAADPATTLVRGENNHGVAKVFVDFMNQKGLVYDTNTGQYVYGQVYDPLFVFGLPVTGAYWVKSKVGGVERPILFQVFERRVLTYNPANPPEFRVEMGNVGMHYREWRYGG
jgi:hypothetical protein